MVWCRWCACQSRQEVQDRSVRAVAAVATTILACHGIKIAPNAAISIA
jgi:hypothetical protein